MGKRKPYDLHDGPGYKLALAARVNDQFMDVSLAEMGLTRQMWCVLIAVGEQAINQPSDIANYIGIKRSALSRTLREMDNKGLLARSNGYGNGNGSVIFSRLSQRLGNRLLISDIAGHWHGTGFIGYRLQRRQASAKYRYPCTGGRATACQLGADTTASSADDDVFFCE